MKKLMMVSKLNSFLLLAIIVLATLCSCSKNTNRISTFPIEQTLKAKPANTPGNLISAYAVTFVNGYYVFTQKDSMAFRVLDTKFHEVCTLARKGHGDNEWMAPYFTSQYAVELKCSYIYVLERPDHSLYKIPVLKNGKRILVESFKNRDITGIRYAFQTGNRQFIGALDEGNCNIFTYNAATNQVSKIPHSDVIGEVNKQYSQYLLQTQAAYNSKQGKLAVTYFSYPLIEIHDKGGKTLRSIVVGNSWPKYSDNNFSTAHNYFLDVTSDDDYIYALYDDPEKQQTCSLLVFDWQGNAVARYYIARTLSIAVNRQNHEILAINEDDSKALCTIYHIGKFK